ncbi:hypothetical protein ACWM35_10350 [Neobacillus sp. K501]
MNSTTTKKNKKGQVVKVQKEAEQHEEVIVSTQVEETETPLNAEVQEEAVQSSTYVESLWNQYEQLLNGARNFHNRSEDVYLKTVKDVIKFNRQYRNSIADFYIGARTSNREIIKGVSSRFAEMNVLNPNTENLTNKADEVSARLEQLASTPIKFTVDLIERVEDKVQESSETLVHYSREGRKGLQKVTNEYVKLVKHNQNMLLNFVEKSTKAVINSNR